jgi:transposase
VGTRPPSELSEKAQRLLQRSRVSRKLMSILEKARKAHVTRVGGANHTAGKDPESSESLLPCSKPE